MLLLQLSIDKGLKIEIFNLITYFYLNYKNLLVKISVAKYSIVFKRNAYKT